MTEGEYYLMQNHPLIYIGIVILFIIVTFAMADTTPKYHADTGRRVQGGWGTDHKRNRKRRQYNRRKMDEAIAIGDNEMYDFYKMKEENSWVGEDYDGRTFSQYKKGMTLEEWKLKREENNLKKIVKNAKTHPEYMKLLEETVKDFIGEDNFNNIDKQMSESDKKLAIEPGVNEEDPFLRKHYERKAKIAINGYFNLKYNRK